MVSPLFFYQLGFLALLWLCIMLHYTWPSNRAPQRQSPSQPASPPQKRSRGPKPFAGLTHKPHCDACAQAVEPRPVWLKISAVSTPLKLLRLGVYWTARSRHGLHPEEGL
jgi:hypothetical protein